MSHVCGCGNNACRERDEMARKVEAEHQADFERYWEALHRPPDRPVAPDHETDALNAVTALYGRFDGSTFLPVPTVRNVLG